MHLNRFDNEIRQAWRLKANWRYTILSPRVEGRDSSQFLEPEGWKNKDYADTI